MTGDALDIGKLIERIDACYGGESLWQLAVELFVERGYERVAYHHFPPMGTKDQGKIVVVTHGYPNDWVEQYIRNKEFIFDPIPTVAMNQSEPFYWRDVRKLVDPTKDQADILDMREERGILNGLAVQVFGPNQRNGYFGFNFGEEDRSLERTEIFELQWICQLLHARYCTLVKQHQPKIPKLSVRELEILEWVARGKSNSVIADIMGLSAHTVDAYIRRIFLKLGTTDRITATVRGIGMGLIRGATPKKSEGPILKLATKI